jgi:hypothetical protein
MSEEHDDDIEVPQQQVQELEEEKAERLARGETGIDISQDPALEDDDEGDA